MQVGWERLPTAAHPCPEHCGWDSAKKIVATITVTLATWIVVSVRHSKSFVLYLNSCQDVAHCGKPPTGLGSRRGQRDMAGRPKLDTRSCRGCHLLQNICHMGRLKSSPRAIGT